MSQWMSQNRFLLFDYRGTPELTNEKYSNILSAHIIYFDKISVKLFRRNGADWNNAVQTFPRNHRICSRFTRTVLYKTNDTTSFQSICVEVYIDRVSRYVLRYILLVQNIRISDEDLYFQCCGLLLDWSAISVGSILRNAINFNITEW